MATQNSLTSDVIIDRLYELKQKLGVHGLISKLSNLDSGDRNIADIKNSVIQSLCKIHDTSIAEVMRKYTRKEGAVMVKTFACAILYYGYGLKLDELSEIFSTNKTVFSKTIKAFKGLSRKNKIDIITIEKFDQTIVELVKLKVIDEKQCYKIKKNLFITDAN